MFIQVIEGHTSDAAGLRRQIERWQKDVGPGATGYLGSTGGVAADGAVIVLARFESEDAARANSARPEQDAWWRETEPYFDGDVTFRDCAETDTILAGGRDDAGFVQVMTGTVADKARLRQIEEQFLPVMVEKRPDLIGSVRAWDGDRFTEAIYFTSEADARKGEAAMADMETTPGTAEYGTLFGPDMGYIDLTEPWLHSP